ncbi:MAG: phospholipase A [Candidatus Thiodiazotropha sp.]|jgi:phospholipase A1/A2
MSLISVMIKMSLLLLMSSLVVMSGRLVAEPLSEYQRCLLNRLESATPSLSVSDLKAQCEKSPPVGTTVVGQPDGSTFDDEEIETDSLIGRRIDAEQKIHTSPFVLLPHKQNYALLFSYNDMPNYKVYNEPKSYLDRVEMKFQLSFKMPVVENLFGSDAGLYAAYTALSFWQAYNRDISSPFRETVHEPEMFLQLPDIWPQDWAIYGWRNVLTQFGGVHQSNGQGGYRSRSWNRLYANFLFERNNLLVGFKPWYRIPEEEEDDDNPDIDDFLGRYELYGFYKKREQTFSLLMRNLFDGEDRDTLQLDWSFPLYGHWRGYMQYFYGYGESMIDYNAKSHRLGLGLQLTDWL